MKLKDMLDFLAEEDGELEVVFFDPDTRLVYPWDGISDLELPGRLVISLGDMPIKP